MVKFPLAKILIVDDEERNRRLFDVFAKADGYVTVGAASGEAGLALAIAEQPDIILLDLMMPGMDGFEVVRVLKNNPVTRTIPIIIVTALDDLASHQRMLACGADEFINKPVDRWELSLRVSKLLQARRDASPSIGSLSSQGSIPNG
jgi:putative two-component system response regulator